VKQINTGVLDLLERDRFVPVIAPIGYDLGAGQSYNINADLVAGAIAQATGAAKLILLTDVSGVQNANGQHCSQLDADEAEQWIRDATISGGMIPKVNCCLEAVRHGVSKSHILDGRIQHAILLEMFTDEGIGTVFTSE